MNKLVNIEDLKDAIMCLDWYHQNKHGEMVHGANSDEHQAWYKAEDIYKAIKSVPSAQPGWIPVTERLPEVKQRVLVQQKDGFMMVRKCIDGGHLAWFYSDIVAWMPLPEPWKGEQS